MKKFKLFGVALMAVMFLASCGGGGGSKDEKVNVQIKPSKTKIKGKLSKFLEVVDGTYKISKGDGSFGGDYQILVKVKSIGTTADQFDEIHGNNKGNSGGMTLAILDDTGLPIGGLDKFKLHYGEKDKVIYLLENQGEEDFLKFTVDIWYGSEIYENGLPENINSFEVGSEVTDYEPSASSDNYSSSSNYSDNEEEEEEDTYSSSNSEDWDAVLKSYESYIDLYIKLMKKAKNGDMSAMTEYVSMMEKATDLAEKMGNAGDDLSATQIAKFVKLQTKLANAAAGM